MSEEINMNIAIFTLAVVGPGLIAGGIVLYLKSARGGLRALGAAFIASGAAMLAIFFFITPVFITSG